MRVHIATDHAGYSLKNAIAAHLANLGFEVTDHGAHVLDKEDDYPGFCIEAAQAVIDDPGSLGIVIGGSGNGEQIAANKVPGIRAALAWNVEIAHLARQHNDANVLSLGARAVTQDETFAIVQAFLDEPFTGAARHSRRIAAITAYEQARG
ncbi:MAG: ribose-5-phosphate isomerase [Micrococcales bacterium]|nr:ribose-5-phosphate isomerase [Micrococcales bacterium]